MLQVIESYILQGIQWFYLVVPGWIGLTLFWPIAAYLFILQFQKRKDSYIPGIFGLIFGAAGYYHQFGREIMVKKVIWLSKHLAAADPTNAPIQWPFSFAEYFFEVFVGSYQYRSIFEECFALGFIVYLGLVVRYLIVDSRFNTKTSRQGGLMSAIRPDRIRPSRSKNNELGSGDLASSEQISSWVKPSGGQNDTVLFCENLRGSQGIIYTKAQFHVPVEQRNKHMLVVAKTGGGKTSQVMLPILYNDCMDPDRSTIVLDSKPEMWRKLAAMTKKYNPNKKIILFNPLDTARSLSWNILAKIETDTDCKLIANTIVMATDNPSSKSDSPFFRNNALALLNALMVGLLQDKNDRLSMPRVHELIQSGNKKLCEWLEAHPAAIRTTRTFVDLVRSGSQNADTIMSELSMRVAAWDLKAIRATTFYDELDLETLLEEPCLFIVELRESEIEMLRPLANVIVTEILRFLIKRAESCIGTKLPRPIGFVIDEFASSLGRLPDIHVKLNTLRSRNVSILAAIQSLAQIKAVYGDDGDSVTAGFSTKIFIPTLDVHDSEWASKESGQMTVRFKTKTEGANKKITEWFESKNDSSQEQVQQRAVLTADEIGRPIDNISTFFFPNTPVFQGFLIPYFKIPEILNRITEFDQDELELKLRPTPIQVDETAFEPGAVGGAGPAAVGGGAGTIPSTYYAAQGQRVGITDTKGWSDEQILKKLEEVKVTLEWDKTSGSARKWWQAFENENKHRVGLVLRLAEELQIRKATITEFFLAYVYSNTDNIQANLCYLDYTRLKREEEKKKKEQREAEEKRGKATGANGPNTAAA